MKIKSISHNVRKETVYDFETPSHNYVLGNGLISHNTQEMFSKAVVSGGTGIYYSASAIFIIGRQQEKDGKDLLGFNFIINIEKSRFTREKSKIPVQVLHESGIDKWSGLLDMAVTSGNVIKPSNGWYSRVDTTTGEIEAKKYREAETHNKDFWDPVLNSESFKKWISETYKVSEGTIMTDTDIDNEMENV